MFAVLRAIEVHIAAARYGLDAQFVYDSLPENFIGWGYIRDGGVWYSIDEFIAMVKGCFDGPNAHADATVILKDAFATYQRPNLWRMAFEMGAL